MFDILNAIDEQFVRKAQYDSQHTFSTVRTFNFCTKRVGSPGIIHDCMPDYHPVPLA